MKFLDKLRETISGLRLSKEEREYESSEDDDSAPDEKFDNVDGVVDDGEGDTVEDPEITDLHER